MVEPMTNEIKSRLRPVSRENLNEKISAQIKALILSKDVPIGQRLPPERELALHFKVSRTVVRLALKSLEQLGLVEIRTGASGGAFVAANHYIPLFQLSYDLFSAGELTLSHFYEARKTIECSTVRLAASKATAAEIERLGAINAGLMGEQTDPTLLGEHNTAFHVAIAEISGNPLLCVIVQSIMALLCTLFTGWDQVRTRASMADMYKRHEAIIRAIKDRDQDRAEKLMANDTEFTRRLDVSRN
jgi:DNA-binding FadR family transcriptional regulator